MAELIWVGKYRADGKRATPARVALPFQTVETVNESTADRKRELELFAKGRPTEWRNRLIWGDKKYVLPSLLPEFAGKVDLVYIDPPFNTDSDFSFTTMIPEGGGTLEKTPSVLEQKAYRDTWGGGVDSYLEWFSETVSMLYSILSERGSIYVHLDHHIGNYAKAVLDEVFGSDRFRSQIAWKRTSAHSSADRYGPVHDVIFYYSKSSAPTWNPLFVPYEKEYVDLFFEQSDADGRRWKRTDMTGQGTRNGETGKPWRGIDVTAKGRHWAYPPSVLDQLDAQGKVHWPKSADGMPRMKQYADESPGVPLQDIWTDIRPLHNLSVERLGYPTQKPEVLLERIIKASSNEGDLILDCFCGSGTTAATAEKLGRRWITCDLGRFAVHTARKRLLSIEGVRPFVVQNLGKYERQAWMKSEFDRPEDQAARETTYRAFILGLYRAQELPGFAWIHGVREKRLVHVGAVDAPVTLADVKAIAREALKASSAEGATKATVDILGWEFAFELNEMAKTIAAEAQVEVRFRRIPNDALDKRAVERGDIKPSDFFELRMLSAKLAKKKRAVTLEITDFILSPEDLPADVQAAVKHWSQWIDYWAVDWDWKNDTFHNEWQAYRTREVPKLPVKTTHEYKAAGTYAVMVKVIDILGNDTTRVFPVEVA